MVSDEKSTVILILFLYTIALTHGSLHDFLFVFWSMDIIYLGIDFVVYLIGVLSFLDLRFSTIKSLLLQIFLLFHSLFLFLIFWLYMCFTFWNHATVLGCSGVIVVVGFFSTRFSLLMRPSEKLFISFSVFMISSIPFWFSISLLMMPICSYMLSIFSIKALTYEW